MIVNDDPVVVDESIKFSFDNVKNEVVSSENDCERVLPGCPIHGL
jgi:hypothetical protein